MITMPENVREYVEREYNPPKGYRSISVSGCIDGSLCTINPFPKAMSFDPASPFKPISPPEEKETITVKEIHIGKTIALVGYSRESNTVLFQVQ